MIYIYPYNVSSESAARLAASLGARRIRRENSTFKGKPDKVVINWGCSEVPEQISKCKVLNKPSAVSTCSDKVAFFQAMKDTSHVPFTFDKQEAAGWIKEGFTVFCRTHANGYGGRGIVVAEIEDQLVDCKLYTKYIPKKDEYRIHIFQGEPFVVQRKAVAVGVDRNVVNWKIRNAANGFIFAKNEDREIPEDVITQAKNAFNSIEGLDFGSVDVIWNEFRKKAFVLEINTASGIDGTTVDSYAEKFQKFA